MQYLSQILSFIGGLASGFVLKFWLDKSNNKTVIKGNKARGDIAGRDINKNNGRK